MPSKPSPPEIPYLLPEAPPSILTAATAPDSLTAALRYAALGFSVLPLRGKRPALHAWKRYQGNPAPLSLIRAWGRAGLFGNVGLVCGPASGGLVVLDLDGREAYRTFREGFPTLAETFTVSSGGGQGRHVYLYAEQPPPPARALATRLGNLELRSTGGQVAAPPSLHPHSGRQYTVSRPLAPRRVNDLDGLIDWISSLKGGIPQQRRSALPSQSTIHADLVATITQRLLARGYRRNGDWLNGPCIYPERHAQGDRKSSFGLNTRSGYGWCFVCGSMTTKEIIKRLDPGPTQ